MGKDAIRDRGRLPSILLAGKPRFTDSTNDTTATAQSRDGNTIAVSFWVAEPPQLSLFSIHCTKPSGDRCLFSVMPRVVGANGPFVLFRAALAGSGTREFFLYKAGAPPSLERIPSPDEFDGRVGRRRVMEFGILGRGGGHYLLAALRNAPLSSLAALRDARLLPLAALRDAHSSSLAALRNASSSLENDDYQLQIYSSETKSWSTRTLHNPCPGVDRVIPDKVITLGQGGLLGWVDLSHGVLVCDLLLLQDPNPSGGGGGVSFFIPLPEPLPGNRYKQKYPILPTKKVKQHPAADALSNSASWFRDLVCVNGVLKFIEMEYPPPENKEDNIIYDSDLIMSLKRKAVDGNIKQQLSSFRDAWRVVTWSREVSSSWSNFWRQTCAAHVSDIKGQQLTLTDLYSAFPILSLDDGDDILYLRSLVETSHRDGWVAAVDIGNKALKATGQYYLPDDCYFFANDPEHPFCACTLSRHLDMTPGIEVSACRKITKASSSANHPSETSIRVGSSKPRTTIQSLSELANKIKRARNPPESTMKNPHISQVHPVENNMPQEHNWDAPPGHSLWTHQNNLPPQQCFSKPDGPCGPGYGSLAPVHGRHNYQPLWRKPYPSKQQLTSRSEFGHHEAPQPCFNNANGASYHGYSASYHGHSQQFSAPSSFTYGAHTGYGNYQQQWQQLPPTLELPIGASWQHPPPPM